MAKVKALFLILVAVVLVVDAAVLRAGPATEPRAPVRHALDGLDAPRTPITDLIPLSASLYLTSGAAAAELPTVRSDSKGLLRYYGSSTAAAGGLFEEGNGGEPRKRNYFPVLMSLLVPGTGEIYMGYYARGAVLVGLEALAWTGYAVYHGRGLDSREAYERFADAHWSYDDWIFYHRALRDVPEDERTFDRLYEIGETWTDWPGFHTWHSKEEEKQNYYENIGKYDWFISGWEDWVWDDVTNPDNPPRDTDLRDEYRAMRKKSNDELDDAQKFIYLSLGVRVFSLVETVLLVRKDNSGEPPAEAKKLTVGARATGLSSAKVELKYRW